MKQILRKAWLMKYLLNIWPPFLFTGIRVIKLSADFKEAKIQLTQRPWNTNAVGVHFGGSLYAMTDPFYMLMILAQVGKDYIVWDKSADIEYIKPGKGKVFADFVVSDGLIDEILRQTQHGDKYLPQLPVSIVNEQGELVAKLNRTMYIRKKRTNQ
jgi:acyl-coenzyme A thioesterase PaaI-like protein